jgi:hypothetical protein
MASQATNLGYSAEEIGELKAEMKALKQNFVINEEHEERDAEGVYFYFVGKHEGKEVIFDAFLYTLNMEYDMQLYEAAEERMATKFPEFKKTGYDNMSEDQLEYMDMLLAELEEDDAVRVQEFVDVNDEVEFGVGLDVCLNVEDISDEIITRFVQDFNSGKLVLDETEYSFAYNDEE